jgi:hypothetical protein
MPRSVVGAAMIRKRNHWLEPIKLPVHETRAGLRTICTEVFRWPQSFPTATPRRRAIGRYADKIRRGQTWCNAGRMLNDPAALCYKWLR